MPQHDLVVIGSGPGGYVAAIRAAQLGLNTACVESVAELGGTCLRVGCIPSKALLESSEQFHFAKDLIKVHGVEAGEVTMDFDAMMKRKEQTVDALTSGVAMLFKKNNVTRYEGHGRLDGTGKVVVKPRKGDEVTLETKHVILATGSVPVGLPGIEFDHDRIGTSTEGLAFPDVPKKLIVIGAGYIGLELGSVWNRLGSEVTVVEYLDRVLPGMDLEVAKTAQKLFRRQGLNFNLGAKVTGARVDGDKVIVDIEGQDSLTADRVLVAVGRKPNTEGLGLETLNIATDQRGRIEIDDHFRTSATNIYAIGDVVRGPMLAHKAEEEGTAAAEIIAGKPGHVDYNSIPGVVYTHPEIASVGRTEEQLAEADIPYNKGIFHFKGNGRARALNETDGFVKMLAHAESDRVLGVHIIGPRAGDLIAEAAIAMAFGASSEDIALASHAHPTLAEAIKEAALAVDGRAIHA